SWVHLHSCSLVGGYGVRAGYSKVTWRDGTDLPTLFSDFPPVPTWILVLSLSLAGAVFLLAGLVAVVLVVRRVKLKNLQKKRDRESCWAQINFNSTDMSFDNSLFTVSAKTMPEEDPATLDDHSGTTATPSNSRTRKRPTSTSSSPEIPEFSTFRACQ
ncbi:protein HIDE1-like, partial [Papio anubis]|uniref:protein HIDE1-like n=1 Tax=Papio anubis TaxID=9555 RepID=UPI0012AE08BB